MRAEIVEDQNKSRAAAPNKEPQGARAPYLHLLQRGVECLRRRVGQVELERVLLHPGRQPSVDLVTREHHPGRVERVVQQLDLRSQHALGFDASRRGGSHAG